MRKMRRGMRVLCAFFCAMLLSACMFVAPLSVNASETTGSGQSSTEAVVDDTTKTETSKDEATKDDASVETGADKGTTAATIENAEVVTDVYEDDTLLRMGKAEQLLLTILLVVTVIEVISIIVIIVLLLRRPRRSRRTVVHTREKGGENDE